MTITTKKYKNEPTLLIVDDEALQEVMLKSAIERNHINVIFCKSGEESLNIIQDNPFITLAIIDILMPVMNGFEVFERIKNLRPELPIIAVSASATQQDMNKALNYGFDELLIKPLKVSKIIESFERYSNLKSVGTRAQPEKTKNSDKLTKNHLKLGVDDLEIALQKQDITLISKALHSIKENIIVNDINAIAAQIESIQIAIKNGAISSAIIMDLIIFLKQLLNSKQ